MPRLDFSGLTERWEKEYRIKHRLGKTIPPRKAWRFWDMPISQTQESIESV
jgi:hypothetical protein